MGYILLLMMAVSIPGIIRAQFLGPDTLEWGSPPTQDMELQQMINGGIVIYNRSSDKKLCKQLGIDRIDYGYTDGRLFCYVLITKRLNVYTDLFNRICEIEGQPEKEQDRCFHWRNYRRHRHVMGCHDLEYGYTIMVTNRK
jgi:hypothetical protein